MRTGAIVWLLVGLWVTASSRVEHCQELQDEDFNLGGGVAHLIYSMKRKCVLCYKEVNKLLTLKSRMAKFGHKMEVSVAMNKSPTSNHRHRLPPELSVDVEDLWRQLGKKNGHIFVFDKCGKLAYQVITPWSKQNYPFTGMAALSAILDDPCGECNVTMEANLEPSTNNFVHPEGATRHSEKKHKGRPEREFDYGRMRLRDSKIPLTIIYRSRHDHTIGGQTVSYNVVELRSDDPTFHGHAETTTMDHFNTTAIKTDSKNVTESEGVELTDQPGQETTTVSPIEYYDDYSDEDESSSSESPMDSTKVQELKRHYEPLMKWMSCAQQIMGI
ncbi:hypothetical protein GE061_004164 [Apolygus lucorum]|uniref:Selenoprotein P N-terminal domain-containing protein n=1 Tax=Apolygus lucorum TaxID=248454 RepID=A0A8S9WZX3_APOLU|nr:hypothetical protein GE061_004164 [Apolygus lucorum]